MENLVKGIPTKTIMHLYLPFYISFFFFLWLSPYFLHGKILKAHLLEPHNHSKK